MPQHRTEDYRQTYGMHYRTEKRCVVCHQQWTKEPHSWCPGVPAYHRWDKGWDKAHADGLRTMTQWKAERRKVKPDAAPRGAMMRGPAHPNDWYDLYTEEQTTLMQAKRERKRTT